MGSQKCTRGPPFPALRTVSSVTSWSISTIVSAITRVLATRPPAAAARSHAGVTSSGRNSTDSPSPGAPVQAFPVQRQPAAARGGHHVGVPALTDRDQRVVVNDGLAAGVDRLADYVIGLFALGQCGSLGGGGPLGGGS